MIDYGYGVSLGCLRIENMEFYRHERNKYNCRRWCRQFSLIDENDQVEWYHSQREDPRIMMFEIVDRSKNPVGVCGLTDIDFRNRRAEFSCWISEDAKRKGNAKKALKTLFKYGFNELGLNIIWGETIDNNPAIELFKSLGMVFEGTRRDFYLKAGQLYDAHLLSVKSNEVNYD